MNCPWIMVFQRDLVRAAEHFLRVARYVFPSPIGDPCELPRRAFLDNFMFADRFRAKPFTRCDPLITSPFGRRNQLAECWRSSCAS